jgi:hypothetical protein
VHTASIHAPPSIASCMCDVRITGYFVPAILPPKERSSYGSNLLLRRFKQCMLQDMRRRIGKHFMRSIHIF